jgi:hypothetical protein
MRDATKRQERLVGQGTLLVPAGLEPNCRLRDCSGMGENLVLLVAHLCRVSKAGFLTSPARAKAISCSKIRQCRRTHS